MSLAWTPDQKEIAKRDKKALVKFQVQRKHSGGGSFQIVGPFDDEHAMMLYLFATFRDEEKDAVVAAVAKVLASREERSG